MNISDKEVSEIIKKEYNRQKDGIELIASENFTSQNVMDALGSIMTNKYSEGQPGKRYYGGNEHIDEMELLCKGRALELFNLDKEKWSVNVQPYSGSPANFAVFTALLKPNDRIMGLDLPSGGHLTHGYYTDKRKISATSIYFQSLPYQIDPNTGLIDYDELQKRARLFRPNCIIAGGSAYPRDWDYKKFKEICDEVGAYLLCDIAHISGIVATKNYNNPFDYADVVTTTTHKSLRGPRSGMIFCKKDLSEKIDFAVFPSLQGGPHNNVIAAVAVALREAMEPNFNEYILNVLDNSKALASHMIEKGYTLSTGGTENHLMLIDLRDKKFTGSKAEYILEKVNISVNKNAIIGDKSALSPGGIRIGLCAMTTRGIGRNDCQKIAEFIDRAIIVGLSLQEGTPKLIDFKNKVDEELLKNDSLLQELSEDVIKFTERLEF
jgi:glycine hydroxymethyltransferase